MNEEIFNNLAFENTLSWSPEMCENHRYNRFNFVIFSSLEVIITLSLRMNSLILQIKDSENY